MKWINILFITAVVYNVSLSTAERDKKQIHGLFWSTVSSLPSAALSAVCPEKEATVVKMVNSMRETLSSNPQCLGKARDGKWPLQVISAKTGEAHSFGEDKAYVAWLSLLKEALKSDNNNSRRLDVFREGINFLSIDMIQACLDSGTNIKEASDLLRLLIKKCVWLSKKIQKNEVNRQEIISGNYSSLVLPKNFFGLEPLQRSIVAQMLWKGEQQRLDKQSYAMGEIVLLLLTAGADLSGVAQMEKRPHADGTCYSCGLIGTALKESSIVRRHKG